jgi:hypothetical protein
MYAHIVIFQIYLFYCDLKMLARIACPAGPAPPKRTGKRYLKKKDVRKFFPPFIALVKRRRRW